MSGTFASQAQPPLCRSYLRTQLRANVGQHFCRNNLNHYASPMNCTMHATLCPILFCTVLLLWDPHGCGESNRHLALCNVLLINTPCVPCGISLYILLTRYHCYHKGLAACIQSIAFLVGYLPSGCQLEYRLGVWMTRRHGFSPSGSGKTAPEAAVTLAPG